jgi:magnesium chelatase family protein
VSGPLLDRIDIHLEVPAVPYQDLVGGAAEESSTTVRQRVQRARLIQRERFRVSEVSTPTRRCRPAISVAGAPSSAPVESLLRTAVARLGLSARAYHRVLKIARTVADLDGAATIASNHVSEAIQYRALDRKEAAA